MSQIKLCPRHLIKYVLSSAKNELVVARVAGYGGNAELTTSLNGKLYLMRPDGVRSSKECIYLDCLASIRRSTREFQSELLVTRAYSEGEQDLLEEEDENMDERTFLIDEALSFECQQTSPQDVEDDSDAGKYVLTWWDPAGDEAIYSFVCSKSATEKEIKAFENVMYRCMYERKYSKLGTEATIADLEEFKGIGSEPEPISVAPAQATTPSVAQVVPKRGKQALFRPDSDSDTEEEDLSRQLTSMNLKQASASVPAQIPASTSKPQLTHPSHSPNSTSSSTSTVVIRPMPQSDKCLYEDRMDYYCYDKATGVFMILAKEVVVQVWLVKQGRTDITNWLIISNNTGEKLLQISLSNDIGVHFDDKSCSMNFKVFIDENGLPITLLLRCNSKDQFNKLNTSIARFMFEASSGVGSFDKLSTVDQAYTRDSYSTQDLNDVDMEDAEPWSDDETASQYEDVKNKSASEASEDEEEEEVSDEEGGSDSDESKPAPSSKGKNSQLAIGYKDDLSFVVRGDMIGVFQGSKDGQKKLRFMTSITGIGTPDGKRIFQPSKVMLHEQDSAMILQNPSEPNKLYKLDLNTGRVVEEYKVGELDVVNFLPGSKFAPTTAEKTFVGHSSNALFQVDPRLAKNQLVNEQYKQYAGNNQFSAAVTTEKGGIAVASSKGDIRFYDTLGKNAKTALPAFGSAITHIDSTKDGRWVVATTDTFLLVIDTQITEGRYAGQSGFDRSFPANAKPTPKRLQLKPEHTAYMNGKVKFTKATFNYGPNDEETTIVTSTGPFVVAWNFRKVKRGQDVYTIKRYDEAVVADSFKYGGDKDIVVTLANDIFLEHKGSLQKPTRDSLGGDIVRHY